MNRNKLKSYAPKARRDFIQAVTDRATQHGLTATKIEPMTEQGEVVLIGGHPFPKSVGVKRKKLETRIQKFGFEQTMEAMAYTWFNRLVAIRFMELHGYLEHGFRVLSHPAGHTQPEILEHAEHVDLPGLDQQKVVEIKLDGTKEEELYRLLLIGQCNALHKALPFLFESINDEAELLLPHHLLHSDSLIRKLENEIAEEDWAEVEVIGWLYQFYISERKDEVIGKVVASEDIPAATQLFTPNWIVKYLVQNTLGRQWLATYPQSPLRQQMAYYIEPAEQTSDVQVQRKAHTPSSINPEELTLLDPACGSGHILVEAYDVFKAIYLERGYRSKDIPAFILQKNLFGMEIDDRAAQLAAFALMMKARADDRRIFDSEAKPNILAFEDSQGMNAADITHALNSPILNEPLPPKQSLFEEIEVNEAGLFSKKVLAKKGHISQGDISSLLELFENAKTFGSLIQLPPKIVAKLPEIEERLYEVLKHGDLTHSLARVLKPLLEQARSLVKQYDAVVANPPYMGSKGMNREFKTFAKQFYPNGKSDLFAMFVERCCSLSNSRGATGMMTPFVWMFLKSYAGLRKWITTEKYISSLVHPEYHSFFESAYVPICSFVISNYDTSFPGAFFDLRAFYGTDLQSEKLREGILSTACDYRFDIATSEFSQLPDHILAYWMSKSARNAFRKFDQLGQVAEPQVGLQTSDNDRFLRLWHEVNVRGISFNSESNLAAQRSGCKWFPIDKGGAFRRWYGNNEYVVNWKDDGKEIKEYVAGRYDYLNGNTDYVVKDRGFFFKPGVTWSAITSGAFSARITFPGAIFSNAGMKIPCDSMNDVYRLAAYLNSPVASHFLGALSPTLNCGNGAVEKLPVCFPSEFNPGDVEEMIELCKSDWDSSERSWNFRGCALLHRSKATTTLDEACKATVLDRQEALERLRFLEKQNGNLFAEAFGLLDDKQLLTLTMPDTLGVPEIFELVSQTVHYSVGCMMGRYSLDEPGLIYADSGNQGFSSSRYRTFSADDDGIIPLTEFNWFADDAANRFERFIGTAWPKEYLDNNLKFVSDSLGLKKGESPRESIRRYFASDFFKHHISFYKKRPIYWLFSSGKLRGFQALVYLHRYNEGTLPRMRTEYVIPLLGKMTARIDHLTDDIAATSSSQHRKRLETEKSTITKQLAEVQSFDEKLRHHADQRINLDLDEGVKVNYGKFGDLLAEVKAVTGGNSDE